MSISQQPKPYLWWTAAAMAVLFAGTVLTSPGQAQVSAKGKETFEKRCAGCHAPDRDKEGPRLGGVYGRTAASIATFQYSPALQKSRIKWTDETLEKWLTDPEKLVPDNDMAFHVESAEERRAIIGYLKQLAAK